MPIRTSLPQSHGENNQDTLRTQSPKKAVQRIYHHLHGSKQHVGSLTSTAAKRAAPAPLKKRRRKPGEAALKDIRKYQSGKHHAFENLIPFAPFKRLVRDICFDNMTLVSTLDSPSFLLVEPPRAP